MAATELEARREAYYEQIRPHHLAPLWKVMRSLVAPSPGGRAEPALWSYGAIRDSVYEAGEVISAKEAERRVLVLENPGMPGESRITTSLYGGLQLILPGEIAPAHRHSQSALRFVVEGDGAYTAVEGEKTIMHVGDFVTTPSWSWHDHGNESDEPMVWLDGLDIPIVQLFDASFAEPLGEDAQPIAHPMGDSRARYGAGLLPVATKRQLTSPVFSYPYDRTREALASLERGADLDPFHGVRLKYVNPTNGDYAIPTMATFMQWLPARFEGGWYRSTDASVFSVVEGSGRLVLEDRVFEWCAKDTLVVPGWRRHRWQSAEEAVLFSFSDRGIQEKLGLWREDRSAADPAPGNGGIAGGQEDRS